MLGARKTEEQANPSPVSVQLTSMQLCIAAARAVIVDLVISRRKRLGLSGAIESVMSQALRHELPPNIELAARLANARPGKGSRVVSARTLWRWVKVSSKDLTKLAPRFPAPGVQAASRRRASSRRADR